MKHSLGVAEEESVGPVGFRGFRFPSFCNTPHPLAAASDIALVQGGLTRKPTSYFILPTPAGTQLSTDLVDDMIGIANRVRQFASVSRLTTVDREALKLIEVTLHQGADLVRAVQENRLIGHTQQSPVNQARRCHGATSQLNRGGKTTLISQVSMAALVCVSGPTGTHRPIIANPD